MRGPLRLSAKTEALCRDGGQAEVLLDPVAVFPARRSFVTRSWGDTLTRLEAIFGCSDLEESCATVIEWVQEASYCRQQGNPPAGTVGPSHLKCCC